MARLHTVLVLGAGASQPYGFPTGRELKEYIWRTLKSAGDSAYENAERSQVVSALEALGFDRALQFDLSRKLEQTPRASIDAFLECQPRFIDLGRAAIVSALLPFESKADLNKSPSMDGRWYDYLYNKIVPSVERVSQAGIGVITFNYDRSFKEYFIGALQNDFELSRDRAVQVLGSIPIIHPYGTLGDAEFGGSLEAVDLASCAEAIQVIGQATEKDAFDQARQLIWDAETICFLGFGYHEENVRRLRISNEWPEGSGGRIFEHPLPPTRRVIGTTRDLTDADISRISGYFDVPVDFDEHFRNMDVLTFLRHVSVLDSASGASAPR